MSNLVLSPVVRVLIYLNSTIDANQEYMLGLDKANCRLLQAKAHS